MEGVKKDVKMGEWEGVKGVGGCEEGEWEGVKMGEWEGVIL